MKKPAFTLIELIVVITIIGLLVGLVILNFREGLRRQDLTLAGNQTYAMLQQARAEVASGKKEEQEDGTFHFLCEGAYFDLGARPRGASSFYDLENGECQIEGVEAYEYGSMPKSVISEAILVGQSTVNGLWVLFEPPNADIVFYSSGGEKLFNDASITFMHSQNEALIFNLSLGSENSVISVTLPPQDAE